MASILSVNNLGFSYGTQRALHEVSFCVEPGEILGVLGHNGAGKSTLFRLLCGMNVCQEGEVFLRQRRVLSKGTDLDPHSRQYVGVMFQEPSLDTKLDAISNLKLYTELYGIGDKTEEIEIFLNTHAFKKEPLSKWSLGMKRQLELYRAFLNKPHLLLMDEPTASLDMQAVAQFRSLCQSFVKQQDSAILMITHQGEEAACLCDRVLILHKGCVLACDSPKGLMERVVGDVVELQFEKWALQEYKKNLFLRVCEQYPEITCELKEDVLLINAKEGQWFIPRLLELCDPGSVSRVNLRKPTLSDAYLKITGAFL